MEEKKNNYNVKSISYFYEMLLAIITIATALLLTLNINLFGDDYITVEQIRNYDYPTLLHNLRYDAHPPVFYMLLKTWSYFAGKSIVGLKTFNAFLYIVLIMASYWVGRQLWGRKYALTAAFTLALFPCMQNNPLLFLRMYLVAALFVMLTTAFAYMVYETPSRRKKCLFLLFSLITCFTHYYATFFIGIIHLILYISLIRQGKKQWKQCAVYALTCIAVFLLWLPTFLKQLTLKQDTISDQTSLLSRIIKSVVFPFHTGTHLPVSDYSSYATTIILLLVTLSIIGIFIWKVSKDICKLSIPEKMAALIAIGLPTILMLGLILVGNFTKPIWFGNYITLYFPVMALGLGFFVWKLNSRRLFVFWFSLLTICFVQKLYLQSRMCQDNAYEKYVALYENGIIKPSDLLIEGNQRSSAYFVNVPQYKAGIERPKDWYSFQYDHIHLVDDYTILLKDRNDFFSTVKLTDSIYSPQAHGFKIIESWHFQSRYYDFIDVDLYHYKRYDTE